jgi:kynureninase
VASQLALHGYTVQEGLITVKPRPGEHILRTEDVVQTIRKEGSSIALILFSGVQYYSGQFFDLETISKEGHDQVRREDPANSVMS